MHATADAHRHHHVMPTSGGPLTRVALSATLHCLTGCAIGEVLGMILGTALGFSKLGTSVLAMQILDTADRAHGEGHGALVTTAGGDPVT